MIVRDVKWDSVAPEQITIFLLMVMFISVVIVLTLPPVKSNMTFEELEKISLDFDRNYCYRWLWNSDYMVCQLLEKLIFWNK